MWDLYNDLEELCETTANELKEANKKIRAAGGKVSSSDVDFADKLTHMLKSIKTTMAMMEAEGGSNAAYADIPHRSSYARRRDSMGRYARSDGHMNYDRAYDSGMMAELRELMEDAPDEQTRQKFQRFINELGQR